MAVLATGYWRPMILQRLVKALKLDGQNVTAITIRFAVKEQVSAVVERFLTVDEAAEVANIVDEIEPLIVKIGE